MTRWRCHILFCLALGILSCEERHEHSTLVETRTYQPSFRVEIIEGRVEMKRPLSKVWEEAPENAILKFGTILFLPYEARVLFVELGREGEVVKQAKLNGPASFRLEPGLMKDLGKLSSQSSKSKSFSLNWVPGAGLGEGQVDPLISQELEKVAESTASPFGGLIEKVTLRYPKNDMVIAFGSLPQKLSILWEESGGIPGSNLNAYKLYFEPNTKGEKKIKGRYSGIYKPGQETYINVKKFGIYRLYLESLDGGIKSNIVSIEIKPTLGQIERVKLIVPKTDADLVNEALVQNVWPRGSQVFLTHSKKTKVTFKWSVAAGLSHKKYTNRLIVISGAKQYTIDTKHSVKDLRLPPGHYYWYVQVLSEHVEIDKSKILKPVVRSRRQDLFIRHNQSLSQELVRFIDNKDGAEKRKTIVVR